MSYAKSIIKLANTLAIKYAFTSKQILREWISGGNLSLLSEEDISDWIRMNPDIYFKININDSKIIPEIDGLVLRKYINPRNAKENKIELITKSSSIKGIIPIESKFLPKLGKVPNLYFHLIKESDLLDLSRDLTKPEEVDIRHSSNFWIRDVLKKILPEYVKNINEIFEKLIIDNPSELQKINNYKNITYPYYLDSGDDGPAYLIARRIPEKTKDGYVKADGYEGDDGSVVIKFCINSYAYNRAKESMNYIFRYPEFARTEARIYDVGKFNVTGTNFKNLYFIIMEKMTPILRLSQDHTLIHEIYKKISKEINESTNFFSELKKIFKKIIHNSKTSDEARSNIKNILIDIIKNYKSDIELEYGEDKLKKIKQEFKLNDNWLEQFIEEIIVKYLTSRTDLQFGNLGVTSYGQLRYFDPAHEKWVNKINN